MKLFLKGSKLVMLFMAAPAPADVKSIILFDYIFVIVALAVSVLLILRRFFQVRESHKTIYSANFYLSSLSEAAV